MKEKRQKIVERIENCIGIAGIFAVLFGMHWLAETLCRIAGVGA